MEISCVLANISEVRGRSSVEVGGQEVVGESLSVSG